METFLIKIALKMDSKKGPKRTLIIWTFDLKYLAIQ